MHKKSHTGLLVLLGIPGSSCAAFIDPPLAFKGATGIASIKRHDKAGLPYGDDSLHVFHGPP
jgi:hypothetical protein